MAPTHAHRIRIFSDGADLDSIRALAANPLIQGFTTNPTLMRKAGITDYEAFARAVLRLVPRHPVSFEVCADDEAGMEAQAYAIARWAPNVNVKIPVTDCAGRFQGALIRRLALAGVAVNVTAVLTLDQVQRIARVLPSDAKAIVSVFAGRIADTGVDPVPIMRRAAALLHTHSGAELLWASPREILNLYQAEAAGCDIITLPPDMLARLSLQGKSLERYSLETVEMFFRDAQAAAYAIDISGIASPAGAPLADTPPALSLAASREPAPLPAGRRSSAPGSTAAP